MNFENKNVLVVGAARSGLSAARLLKKKGANVTLADSKPAEKLAEAVIEMEKAGIHLALGKNAGYELIKEQSFVIASPGVPLTMETFKIAKQEGIEIIGEMELAFMLCPCPVAAITGTNGKTTTTALAGEIIKRHICDTKIVGNIGIPFTDTVDSLNNDSFIVLEASSFQLEKISCFKPKISAILNITPDHLDRHKTMENYIEAKKNIFINADMDCYVVLNYDDPLLKEIKSAGNAEIFGFSTEREMEKGAFLRDGCIIIRNNNSEINLINKSELQILGDHNVQNALAASLIAYCAGAPVSVIREGLAEFKGVSHRIEFVRELDGVKYYNDSKGTNPDASIKALHAMKGKSVLIAGGDDKKSNYDEFTALFNEKVSHLIAIGKTKDDIIQSARNNGFNKVSKAETYEQAVRLSKELAEKGENVLLSPACASWDMFNDYEERGDCFKRFVNEL